MEIKLFRNKYGRLIQVEFSGWNEQQRRMQPAYELECMKKLGYACFPYTRELVVMHRQDDGFSKEDETNIRRAMYGFMFTELIEGGLAKCDAPGRHAEGCHNLPCEANYPEFFDNLKAKYARLDKGV